MFKTARMRKIKIMTLDKYVAPTVRAFHEQGLIQISDMTESIQQDPELAEMVTPSKATPLTGKISSLLMKANGISDLFGNSLSEGHGLKDKLMSFISPDIPTPREVEDLETEAFLEKAEETLNKVEAKTSVIEGKLAALDSEVSELKSNKSLANNLNNFDMDLALLKDSKYTSVTVGRIDAESASEIKNKLGNLTDELDVFVVPEEKATAIIVVITLKEFTEDVQNTLRDFNFEKFEIGNVEGKPHEIISKADSRLQSIESERATVKSDLRVVAEQWDDEILILKEQLENEKEKNEIFSTFVQTDDTYILEAWVPVKDVEKVEQVMEKASEGHYVIEVIDVEDDYDDEDVPILQTNPGYAKPYEFLVGMYAPVRYHEIDPTILVAIMFPFFFGYCLTDAFYGIIVSLVGIVLIRGLGKTSKTMHSMGYILVACGIWTIILGLATNGFIGDFTERFIDYRLPTVVPLIESFVHPENILILALAIGVIYENIGFLIGAIDNIRYGNVKDAIGSQLCWFVLEAGIVLLALGFLMPSVGMIGMVIGAVLIIACLGMLIYANGFYGVMDVFGYLGNILSYARLLALCLATGGIAMTVNILAELCYDMIPFIGIVLAVIVFIFGHIVNMMFNVLGSFINSLRLHYVEFFGQFFMGGSKKFEAFKASRIFTKIKH
ncbi:V-type ATP synthase subunit I [Methanobrevibacter woesei]|uniref:A-type ATP synthase subunit I n=1 Tax=Methanobrevibacter woesei TaxID=190976 RepID=A0A2U1S8R4_9EURY|nr:V-type ATP synthase subunit I [Methanobrevibacter woesei]MCC9261186.1 V-type ATP synthase subunit I [Methanobrevibacter woesei]PWB86682.1 V-type ATP synthase subunit I [Methanobrevibacter woesei]